MELGRRGKDLIQSYEGYKSVAYLPTPDDVPTIAFGHTKGVKLGDTCTLDQANKWFDEDTSSAIKVINSLSVDLSQSMFDALVSLVFNVGPRCLNNGMTIGDALRRGDYYSAWAGFALWRKQAGKDLLGLARRRAKEMMLFLEDGIPK